MTSQDTCVRSDPSRLAPSPQPRTRRAPRTNIPTKTSEITTFVSKDESRMFASFVSTPFFVSWLSDMILLANHGAQGLYMYVSGRSMMTSFFLDLRHCRTTKVKHERTHTTKRERSERDGKEIHPTTKEVGIEQIKAAKEAYENASTSGRAKEGPNERSNQ
jgi:hypothetical protein